MFFGIGWFVTFPLALVAWSAFVIAVLETNFGGPNEAVFWSTSLIAGGLAFVALAVGYMLRDA